MPKRDPAYMQAQRERILRAAIRCISNLGLERTSIAEIRKEAELSAGAIYKHFANKEQIIVEALRFAALTAAMLPDNWLDLKAALSETGDEMGFDLTTVVRTRLQLFASSVRPGPLHDMLKPMLDQTLALVTEHLTALAATGEIKLRLTPLQTAMCVSALANGLMWIGLASDRTPQEIAGDIAAGLECLVSR